MEPIVPEYVTRTFLHVSGNSLHLSWARYWSLGIQLGPRGDEKYIINIHQPPKCSFLEGKWDPLFQGNVGEIRFSFAQIYIDINTAKSWSAMKSFDWTGHCFFKWGNEQETHPQSSTKGTLKVMVSKSGISFHAIFRWSMLIFRGVNWYKLLFALILEPEVWTKTFIFIFSTWSSPSNYWILDTKAWHINFSTKNPVDIDSFVLEAVHLSQWPNPPLRVSPSLLGPYKALKVGFG